MNNQYEIAQAFTNELVKLHTKLDYPSYKCSVITLTLTYSADAGPRVELSCRTSPDTRSWDDIHVKAAELSVLMDEVYRRLRYDGKTEAAISRVSAALKALPSPSDSEAPSDSEEAL